MAFVKTHWVDDSEPAITAAQLNRIEDGIAEAGESSKAIVLTQAEYDALSDEEKDSDNVYYISDAPFESSNVVPLTRAEYDALSDATKMDGRFYYITDEEEVAKSLVVQTNVNSMETVPSSAVVYGLKSDTDADIQELNDSLANYETGILASYEYGRITYAYCAALKIAFIRWSGNGTAPTVGTLTTTVPPKLYPKDSNTRPLVPLLAGRYMELAQYGNLSVVFNSPADAWSAGSFMYPTV